MTYPSRFSASDIALREALQRLDPDDVVEALLTGADLEAHDSDGGTAMHTLLHAAYHVETDSEDALAAACAEALMSRGANLWAYHRLPADHREELCRSREHDCRKCPGAAENPPLSSDPDHDRLDSACGGSALYEFIEHGDVSLSCAPLFLETMTAWIDRQVEDRNLRPHLQEIFSKERESRAISDACVPGRGSGSDDTL